MGSFKLLNWPASMISFTLSLKRFFVITFTATYVEYLAASSDDKASDMYAVSSDFVRFSISVQYEVWILLLYFVLISFAGKTSTDSPLTVTFNLLTMPAVVDSSPMSSLKFCFY